MANTVRIGGIEYLLHDRSHMANSVRIGGIEYLLHARSHMANTVRIGGLNISYMPGRIWLIL